MTRRSKLRLGKKTIAATFLGVALGLGLALSGSSLRGQQPKGETREVQTRKVGSAPKAGPAPQSASDAFSAAEKADIIKRVLAHAKIKASHEGHRLKVLRVTKGSVDDKPLAGQRPRRLADVIVYDNNNGRAEHVLFDAGSDEVVKSEPMRGVPSPNEDELLEAVKIVENDPAHAKLIKAGAHLTGGFLASAPTSSLPPNDRYIQLQLLTPAKDQIERVIVVDLSTGTIASSQ